MTITSSNTAAAVSLSSPSSSSTEKKKTWGQRLKLGKSSDKSTSQSLPTNLSPSTEMVRQVQHNTSSPHYANIPSALSRSMKYADPWLYGTVRGIPAPRVDSSGFLFSPIHAEVAVVVCSCPEYLTGTKREVKKASICKKCKGSRLPLAPVGGTVRIRTSAPMMHVPKAIATVRVSGTKSRPSIFNMTNDPYDLMRRSRLLSPELQPVRKELVKVKEETSPAKHRSRSRTRRNSSENSISQSTNNNNNNNIVEKSNRTKNGNTVANGRWIEIDTDGVPKVNGRRSILSCDVNPYDLVSNTNEFSPSDDLFDAEVLMHSTKYESVLEPDYNKKLHDGHTKTIAGKTIQIQATQQSETENIYDAVEFVEQKLEATQVRFEEITVSSGEVTVLPSSPKRPPRKKQDSSDETDDIEPLKLEMNLSPKSQSPTSPVIKSILKRSSVPTSPSVEGEKSAELISESTQETETAIVEQTTTTTTTTTTKIMALQTAGGAGVTTATITASSVVRKKVQFVAENEIIHDTYEHLQTDESDCEELQVGNTGRQEDSETNSGEYEISCNNAGDNDKIVAVTDAQIQSSRSCQSANNSSSSSLDKAENGDEKKVEEKTGNVVAEVEDNNVDLINAAGDDGGKYKEAATSSRGKLIGFF